ncbi:MAG TPA: MaoC family dehydratase [Bacteroidales bacterium]|nr:MaoC family dehydratase [Bacteroidales bacterium]
MGKVKLIFSDREIVEFCRATEDTNEIHDPAFMEKLGKRVIVPGMFALAYAANLSAGFLRTRARYLRVLFNSLVSSGDFVTLSAEPVPGKPDDIRLSAVNHRDTLTTKEEITVISAVAADISPEYPGILQRLTAGTGQVATFRRLIRAEDPLVGNFLFAVAYASQALLRSIAEGRTEVEQEIGRVISGNSRISPFYQSLEIIIPAPFPETDPDQPFDYYIHFERVKPCRQYNAYVRCESGNQVIFHSRYRLVGISDLVVIRMAKDILHHRQ